LVSLGKEYSVESAKCNETANEDSVVFPRDSLEGKGGDLAEPDGSNALAEGSNRGAITAKMLGEGFSSDRIEGRVEKHCVESRAVGYIR